MLGGVAALHADQLQTWVRRHPAIVAAALVATGAAAEGWYLHSVSRGSSPMSASDVFQPVMLPWCMAIITALFTLGAIWAARRNTGLISHTIEIGSDRSFGVFLVHPLILSTLASGPSAWLSIHLSTLSSTIITMTATTMASLLVAEILRHSPLSMILTGKRRPQRGSPVHPSKSNPSAPTPPIRLGAGRT
jgi:peptidoglycan/LPS O-acetylase OafA/YrhL